MRLCLGYAKYPWYDTHQLDAIELARRYLAIVRPDKLGPFMERISRYKVDLSFRARLLPDFLQAGRMARLQIAVSQVCQQELMQGEAVLHGRVKARHHAEFAALHEELTGQVEAQVGERLEPSYLMFTRYDSTGRLPVHLDSPDSKWALGICLQAPVSWPLHCGRTVEWPPRHDPAWTPAQVLADPAMEFRAFDLRRGDAVLFSGSAQWHYRAPVPPMGGGHFDLLYLQYVPKGEGRVIKSRHWAEEFGIPELADLHGAIELWQGGGLIPANGQAGRRISTGHHD